MSADDMQLSAMAVAQPQIEFAKCRSWMCDPRMNCGLWVSFFCLDDEDNDEGDCWLSDGEVGG